MRSRAIIHLTGPVHSGKMAFVEPVLSSSRWLWTLAARCPIDSTRQRPGGIVSCRHPELGARACLRCVRVFVALPLPPVRSLLTGGLATPA